MPLSTFAAPIQDIDRTDWIAAGNTRNYIKKDPILDWLDHYGLRQDQETGEWLPKTTHWHGYHPNNHPTNPNYMLETDFGRFIREKGKQFESGVLRLITQILQDLNLPAPVLVSSRSHHLEDWTYVQRTFQLMQEGLPVIYQGVVWDLENKTSGAPDLLIRADLLTQIFANTLPPESGASATSRIRAKARDRDPNPISDIREPESREPENPRVREPESLRAREPKAQSPEPSSLIPHPSSLPKHYVVADIKFTTLPLNAKGEIANDKAHNKAQVALYNAALGELQGYTPPVAYLIRPGLERQRRKMRFLPRPYRPLHHRSASA